MTLLSQNLPIQFWLNIDLVEMIHYYCGLFSSVIYYLIEEPVWRRKAIPVCLNQILITLTVNSKSISKFIISISRHYRAKFHKLRGPTSSIEKMSFGDDEMFKDQNDLNDQNDEHNNRYSNSSTSGEFENVFPYREQIDHLLSATTRQIRKSRKETKILFAAANLSWFPQHSSDMGKLMCA